MKQDRQPDCQRVQQSQSNLSNSKIIRFAILEAQDVHMKIAELNILKGRVSEVF